MAKAEPDLYKPADACKMAEVAPYVLRYWETEFPMLAESKEKGGGKLYSGRDVKMIARIRELLYDEGFTVAGAKKRLESEISEGRFDEGLAPVPSAAQKKSGKGATAEEKAPLFASESRPFTRSSAQTPAPRAAAPPPTEFPERKRVLKELKEIARLLQRPSAR